MWLYYLLKAISTFVSWLPYKLVVIIGKGLGRIYHKVAKKQRLRAEKTIKECLGYSDQQAYETIRRVFIQLAITFMEMLYMPALNKDNIKKYVEFDRPEVLWDALEENRLKLQKENSVLLLHTMNVSQESMMTSCPKTERSMSSYFLIL